jgi:hypothetical protein
MKGIQVYSNKRPCPFQRGNNHKNVKIGLSHIKIFSRTMKSEKLRFTGKLPDIV